MNISMRLVLLLVLLGMTGCHPGMEGDRQPAEPLNEIGQKILFEVEYTNRAWGYHHFGIWVDNNGAVWRYELAEGEGKLDGSGLYGESDLLNKYMHKKEPIATVQFDTLWKMYQRIGAAYSGRNSDTTNPMADAGTVVYSAWTFDSTSATYREVGLRMRGDLQYDNLAPEARAIADWLETLWGTTRK